MRALSHFLSWIFLPLLMPLYGILLTLYIPSQPETLAKWSMYSIPDELKTSILYIFFVFGALLPAISFFELFRRKFIGTIDMENRLERSLPLIIMLIFCLLLFGIFIFKAPNNLLPKYCYALPLSGAIVMSSFLFINRFIKISLHAGGAGILVGYLLAFFSEQIEFELWILLASVVVSGLTIMARLYLNKHLPIEVYTGWTLAMLITFLTNFWYPIA